MYMCACLRMFAEVSLRRRILSHRGFTSILVAMLTCYWTCTIYLDTLWSFQWYSIFYRVASRIFNKTLRKEMYTCVNCERNDQWSSNRSKANDDPIESDENSDRPKRSTCKTRYASLRCARLSQDVFHTGENLSFPVCVCETKLRMSLSR